MESLNAKEMFEGVMSLKDNFTLVCESLKLQAQMDKVSFDSLVKEGFSEEQALELVKAGKGS